MSRSEDLAPIARRGLLVIAAVTAGLLITLSGRYGYHRDELYFLASGHHLAWGYPDQPPLVPFIARLMSDISATSLVVLRLPSALATAATVFFTGLIAREMGAEEPAQLLAAAAMAASPFVLATGHLLSTSTVNLTIWAAVIWLSLRAVRAGRDWLWLVVGLVAGIGVLATDLVGFLMAALVISVAICGPRRIFGSPWFSAGAIVMLAIWSPYLVWQAHHGWPELTVAHAIASGASGTSEPRWEFLPYQLLLTAIFSPIWISGLIRLWRDPALRWCRSLAVAYGVLIVVFIITGGKPYYVGGMYPALFGAGAAPVMARRRAGAGREWLAWAVGATAVAAVITLPVVPLAYLHDTPIVAINYDTGETVAWPTYVAQIASVYARVPIADRASTIVLTSNYGEGGAVDRYGTSHGLPSAFGVQDGFWLWGPPPETATRAVAVGFDRQQVQAIYASVQLAGRLNNHLGVNDDEQGAPVWWCAGRRSSWAASWLGLRVYA